MVSVNNIMWSMRRDRDILNILTFLYDTDYDHKLFSLPHHFFVFDNASNNFPQNVFFLEEKDVPIWVNLDLILSNDNVKDIMVSKDFSIFHHIPVVCYYHKPFDEIKKDPRWIGVPKVKIDMNIYSSELVRETWNDIGFILPEDHPKWTISMDNILHETANTMYVR